MTHAHRNRGLLAAIASASLLALAACGSDGEGSVAEDGTIEPGTQTVAALIAASDELSQVESVMQDAGLSTAFDAAPNYTIFAPTDEALAALGDDFSGDEARAALVAILREHVVPGYLTTQDIAAAIEANGGPVAMATMGEGTLTFAMDGDAVTVSSTGAEDGAAMPEEMLGSNGVVIPVDAVLKDLDPAS